MTNKDIIDFAKKNWHGERYNKTITEVSKIKENKSLVESEKIIYCFDNISEDIYRIKKQEKPESLDGLMFLDSSIVLVEFKTGFKKRITRNNLDKSKMTCDKTGAFCGEYMELFFSKQKMETSELKDSLKIKALESYITFEKEIFPLCNNLKKEIKLELIVVIDGNSDDAMLSMLGDLSEKSLCDISGNCYNDVKKSLNRYIVKKDNNKNDYFYDSIRVMSVQEFKCFIDKFVFS